MLDSIRESQRQMTQELRDRVERFNRQCREYLDSINHSYDEDEEEEDD